MLKRYISLILFVSFFMVSTETIAQPGPPCDNPDPDTGICPPPGTPIDGGVILLLAAGVALGIKKLNDKLSISN